MSSRTVAALSAALVLTGCAGMSEQACLTSDWRTVGFEDGTVGRSVSTIGSYRQQCSEHGVQPDLEAYRAGHAEGVEVYCKPGHAFEIGHSGASYQGVCPAGTEAAFLAEYNSGRHLYELEWAVRDIDAQIADNNREQEHIRGELTAIAASMVSNDTTGEQRVLLVSRSAELGRRYGELTTATKALEQERVSHALELTEYRQLLAADR